MAARADPVHAPDRPRGLETSGLAVLQNAVTNHVRIDVVNPMVFDYYDRVTTDMGGAAVNARPRPARAAAQLLPAKTPWTALGDAGRHDHERSRRLPPADRSYRTSAHAQQLLDFANANGMSTLSMWAIQRDNGGCPGIDGGTIAPGSSRGPGTSVTCWGRSPGRSRPDGPSDAQEADEHPRVGAGGSDELVDGDPLAGGVRHASASPAPGSPSGSSPR